MCLLDFSTVGGHEDAVVAVVFFFFASLSVVFGLEIKVSPLTLSLECVAVCPCDFLDVTHVCVCLNLCVPELNTCFCCV